MFLRLGLRTGLLGLVFALSCFIGHASSLAAGKRPVYRGPTAPSIVLPNGWPKVFSIPRFGVQALVEDIAFQHPADEHAPYRWNDVAWYDHGPKPGAQGMAVIYGHLDSTCCPAVFYHVRDMVPGDRVLVTYSSGQTVTFQVVWSHTYWNNEVPFGFIYGQQPHRGLVLLTCTGTFHLDGSGYDHKTMVYLRLVMPNGKLG